MKLLELEQKKRQQMAEDEAKAKAEAERQEQARSEFLTTVVKPVVARALATDDLDADEIMQYMTVETDEWWYEAQVTVDVTLELPEHLSICTRFRVENGPVPATCQQMRDLAITGYTVYQKLDLAAALVIAADLWQANQQYEEKERLAEQNWQARQEKMANENERDELPSALESDPVALALLKVFLALQDEREGYRNEIEFLETHIEGVESRADERARTLERELQSARNQRDDYRQRVWDANDRAEELEKKQKRGW